MSMVEFTCNKSRLIELFTSRELAEEIAPKVADEITNDLYLYLRRNGGIDENSAQIIPKPGVLSARVPGTSVHVRVTKLVNDLVRLSIYAFCLTQGEVSSTVGLLDVIHSIQTSFTRLRIKDGHLCVYEGILQARRRAQPKRGTDSPSSRRVYEALKSSLSSCRNECRFFREESCALKRSDLEDILTDLVEMGVVVVKANKTFSIVV